MRRTVWLLVLTVLAVPLAVVGLSAPAAAHPYLIETIPQAGRAVAEPPKEIGLVFDEQVSLGPNAIVLDGQARGPVPTTEPERIQGRDGYKVVVRPDQVLPDGRYAVRWQVVGQDGHAVSGSFGFGVGSGVGRQVSGADAAGSTSTPGLPSATVLRWLVFAGLALVLGGLVGEWLVRARLARATAGRRLGAPRPWVLVGCLAGALGAAGLAVQQVGGGSLLAGVRGFGFATLLASEPGRLVGLELAAFLLAAAVSWRWRWATGVVLLVALVAEAGRNHLFVEAGGLGGLLVAVHLLAAAVWVGALIHVARTAFGWRGAAGDARALFVSYAYLAAVLYGLVVTTGTIGAIVMLPSLDALVGTGYGQVLLAKLALVLTVSALALVARHRLHGPSRLGDGLRIVHLVRGERAALAGVLAVTAILASMPTPTPDRQALAYPPPVRGTVLRMGELAGAINVGLVVAYDHLEVHAQAPESDPRAEQPYQLTAFRIADRKRRQLELDSCGQGCFFGTPSWREGTNVVDVRVDTPGWNGGQVRFEIPWPVRERPELLRRALDRMAAAPWIIVDEVVTSDTSRPDPPAGRQRLRGKELLELEPYKSGSVGTVAELDQQGRNTWIGFGLQSQEVYVRLLVAPDGRVIRETISSPRHLIRHRLTYPSDAQG